MKLVSNIQNTCLTKILVDWYEALILFSLYIIYAVFMKYNSLIEQTVKRKLTIMSASVGIDRKVLVEVIKKTYFNI